MTPEQFASVPGVARREAATTGFIFNHTMLRVRDIRRSLDFYTRVLGFSLVDVRNFDADGFSLYFLALIDDPARIPADAQARRQWLAQQAGV